MAAFAATGPSRTAPAVTKAIVMRVEVNFMVLFLSGGMARPFMGRTARLREAAGVATWLQTLRAAGPLHFEPETTCCAPAAATGIGQPLLRLWECADSCGRCQRSGMFRVTVHGGHGATGRTCCTAGHRRREGEGQLRVGSSCSSLPIPVIGLVTDGGRARGARRSGRADLRRPACEGIWVRSHQ